MKHNFDSNSFDTFSAAQAEDVDRDANANFVEFYFTIINNQKKPNENKTKQTGDGKEDQTDATDNQLQLKPTNKSPAQSGNSTNGGNSTTTGAAVSSTASTLLACTPIPISIAVAYALGMLD